MTAVALNEVAPAAKPAAHVLQEEILVLDPATVQPQDGQPRIWFNEEETLSLAQSIDAQGQLQPASVFATTNPAAPEIRYEIIDGERRWRVCTMLGRFYRPVLRPSPAREIDQFIESLTLNFHRADHHALEVAYASDRLRKEANLSDVEIGKIFGKSHSWVFQHRRLLLLDEKVLGMMTPRVPEDRRLRFTHAQELVDLPPGKQIEMAQKAVTEGMKLIELKAHVRRMPEHAHNENHTRPVDDYRTLSRFLTNLNLAADGVLDMKEERFSRMFAARSLKDRVDIYVQAKHGVESLTLIMQEIERKGLIGLTEKQKKEIGRRN